MHETVSVMWELFCSPLPPLLPLLCSNPGRAEIDSSKEGGWEDSSPQPLCSPALPQVGLNWRREISHQIKLRVLTFCGLVFLNKDCVLYPKSFYHAVEGDKINLIYDYTPWVLLVLCINYTLSSHLAICIQWFIWDLRSLLKGQKPRNVLGFRNTQPCLMGWRWVKVRLQGEVLANISCYPNISWGHFVLWELYIIGWHAPISWWMEIQAPRK